ncbi:hypothetical protein U9M48_026953 [Paspalum notatum var. saurae]|uniref:Cell division cycle protein 27 homolog B n=1 Tax=Paspalum notatum var. saurae TaxID=547442 RepID=A0AAQ3WZH6_PASNO
MSPGHGAAQPLAAATPGQERHAIQTPWLCLHTHSFRRSSPQSKSHDAPRKPRKRACWIQTTPALRPPPAAPPHLALAAAAGRRWMETLMVDRVHSCLRLFMHRNAVFLCERLCAQFPSETNVQLLATCYLHNDQPYAAYHILKGKKLPVSRYLFATSCFRMNLLREAEETLCPVNEPNVEISSGATGHYLLGVIYRCTGRISTAAEQFTLALTLDPLLWAAYEELCILGVAEDPDECFSESIALRLQQEHASTSTLNSATSNVAQFDTPSPTAAQTSGIMPPPLFRNAHAYQNTMSGEAPTKQKANGANQPLRRKYLDEARLKKVSGRLFNQSSDSMPRRSARLSRDTTMNSNSNTSQFGGNGTDHSSGSRYKVIDEMWTDNISVTSSSVSSVDGRFFEQDKADEFCHKTLKWQLVLGSYWDFCEHLGKVLGFLACLSARYDLGCLAIDGNPLPSDITKLISLVNVQEALEVYRKLPEPQFNTGWVLCQVGKAYFELVDYLEADHYFELAHRLSPCTLDGMDIYSTVLYHLNEEMRLSYLAQDLISIDRLSPQAWCAVGNCFALRKDHETALKNFQRSVQLDSRFAYAHTLCGHEYSALEDYENSIKFYRCALQIDERHYNAWYGLGVVYLRQEKFEFAEHHFRRAFQINPRSSVLMCYLGMALHSLKVEYHWSTTINYSL